MTSNSVQRTGPANAPDDWRKLAMSRDYALNKNGSRRLVASHCSTHDDIARFSLDYTGFYDARSGYLLDRPG